MADSTSDPARTAGAQNAVPTGPDRPIPWSLIGAGLIAALVIVVLVQNREIIPVDFLFIHFSMPLWLLLLSVFLLGVLLNGLVRGGLRRAMKKDEKPAKK